MLCSKSRKLLMRHKPLASSVPYMSSLGVLEKRVKMRSNCEIDPIPTNIDGLYFIPTGDKKVHLAFYLEGAYPWWDRYTYRLCSTHPLWGWHCWNSKSFTSPEGIYLEETDDYYDEVTCLECLELAGGRR